MRMSPFAARRRTALARRRSPMVAPLGFFTCCVVLALGAGCPKETAVEVYVDGFEPENVRFEVEELGAKTHDELTAISRRGDIDGVMLLPDNACAGPCQAALVSIFVHNRAGAEAPPVVRLKAPSGRAVRQPIAFRGDEISQGRIGRLRWLVELWPEEQRIAATLSASVRLVEPPAPAVPPAVTPAAPPAAPPADAAPQARPTP